MQSTSRKLAASFLEIGRLVEAGWAHNPSAPYLKGRCCMGKDHEHLSFAECALLQTQFESLLAGCASRRRLRRTSNIPLGGIP